MDKRACRPPGKLEILHHYLMFTQNLGDCPGPAQHLFQISSRTAQADLHDQRHRGIQPPAQEGDEGKIRISDR